MFCLQIFVTFYVSVGRQPLQANGTARFSHMCQQHKTGRWITPAARCLQLHLPALFLLRVLLLVVESPPASKPHNGHCQAGNRSKHTANVKVASPVFAIVETDAPPEVPLGAFPALGETTSPALGSASPLEFNGLSPAPGPISPFSFRGHSPHPAPILFR